VSATASVTLDLSGLLVRVGGLDDGLASAFEESWGAFVAAEPDRTPWLDVAVDDAGRAIPELPHMRPSMAGEVRETGARFESDEGTIELDAGGRALARLGSGAASWRFWGLANLLYAAIAARLPSRPGVMLHAAGIVVEGRAFLLTGAAGSGKSTFARAARDAGARVVSDDSVIVDGGSGGPSLLGTPVRASEARPGGPGRWPVAAILHARWGSPASLGTVPAPVAQARLAANFLFVSSGWGKDARLPQVLDLMAALPQRELTFAPDPSFVSLLRESA
jgi:hypothetical protein